MRNPHETEDSTMKRWLTFGLLAAMAPWVMAQDGQVWTPKQFPLDPFDRVQTALTCSAGRAARVLVIGDGATPVAAYVYDPRGHCIGYDDEPSLVYDDRVVAWTASVAGAYEVLIQNFGSGVNRIDANAR
jgi:hypothetical protein